MSVKKSFTWFILLFFSVFTSLALADSPLTRLQTTANQIIQELQKNKANLRTNPRISYNIVTKYLVPLVDEDTMSQAVVGRNAWNSATSSQKAEFMQQFQILVVRTYAAAIAQFSDEQIQFRPLRGFQEGQTSVTIYSQIVRNNAPAIPVSYNMVLRGKRWFIVDFSVDNVSMVQSFKSQFQSQLSQGGLPQLIASLKEHNSLNG